jgi:S1-C subfamily serine protease
MVEASSMNIIDFFIIIFAIGALFRGFEIGFVRQFFSTLGFVGGLWIGALLQPHTIHLAHTDMSKTVITLLTTLGCAFLLLAVGEYVGVVIKRRILKHSINPIDYALGAGLAVISLLLTVWLSANIFASLPYQSTKQAIQGSATVRFLNSHLPSAPAVISDLGHLIDPNGFPDVFAGVEPVPASKLPQPGLRGFQTAIAADQVSVVKIEGQGCGGIVEGSGFVADKDLVLTNAHVVAGISHIIVEDQNGSHTAVPIWFDPNLDFAILRVSDLAGKPLDIDTSTQSRGTPGAVLGYPGGGGFNVKSAAYLDEFIATGRNIYGTGETKRDVYEVQADIIPGNSGGPIINQHGQVTSMVFAESTSYQHIGYSLDMHQLLRELQTAKDQNRTRGTGSCAE